MLYKTFDFFFSMLGTIFFYFSNQLSWIIKFCEEKIYVNQLMELSKYISSDFFLSGQDCIWIIGTAPHSLSRDMSAHTAEVSLCFNWLSVELGKNLSQRQKLVSNYKEIKWIIFSIFLPRRTVFSCDIPRKLCELRWDRTFLCIKSNNSLPEQINLWSTSKAVY